MAEPIRGGALARPPTDWYDTGTRFTRTPGTGALTLGAGVLLANEQAADPVLLDPIEAEVWHWLDGDTTVGDLVDDLTTVLGATRTTIEDHVAHLLWRLATGGCLARIELPAAEARRVLGTVEADSCVGKRMGLGRATRLQLVRGDRALVRIGSTDPALLDRLVAALPDDVHPEPFSGRDLPFFMARLSEGRTPRMQQVFDALGDPVVCTFDPAEAKAALDRAVVAALALDASEGVWVDAPALCDGSAVVLLPPGARPGVTGPLRRALHSAGIDFVPTTHLRIDLAAGAPARVVAPAGRLPGTPELSWPVAAAVVGTGTSEAEVARDVAHLVAKWDDRHLAAAAALAGAVELVHLPTEVSGPEVVAALVGAFTAGGT